VARLKIKLNNDTARNVKTWIGTAEREREDAKERYRFLPKEAKERRKRRMKRQFSSQSEMMQIFMLSMMEGHIKRKRDDRSNEHSNKG
jgi:hypothetical protein